MKIVCAAFFGVVILASCSSETGNNGAGVIGAKDSVAHSDSAHLFILPAPLQVATFLRTHEASIQIPYLADKSIAATNYNTDYQRALNLGINITDVGYAALYNNRQLALDYLARTEELVKALRIEPAVSPYMERIRRNIENQDSLSYLLLTLYDDVQNNLNQAKREKTAFYVASGCYLESLAITLQHNNLKTKPQFIRLVAQEKMWLDNLAESITYLEPDEESQDLFNTFFTLQDCYKDIPVKVENNLPSCTYTPEAFIRLRDKSIQLRNAIVANS